MRARRSLAFILRAAVLVWMHLSTTRGVADEWYTAYSHALTVSLKESIPAISGFKDALYIISGDKNNTSLTTTNHPHLLRLRNEPCAAWEDVQFPFPDNSGAYSGFLLPFQGSLYAAANHTSVFASTNGTAWRATGLPIDDYTDAVEFGGKLYICGFNGDVYSTANGTTWTTNHLYVLDSKLFGLSVFAVHNGRLFCGGSLKSGSQGVIVFVTDNGLSWSVFESKYPEAAFVHIHGMCSFGSYLYVGQYHGGDVWRTEGLVSNSLVKIDLDLPQDIVDMVTHNGVLYAALSYTGAQELGEPIVYYTANGTDWFASPDTPINTNGVVGAVSLLSWSNRLYVGGESIGLEPLQLYAYAATSPPPCETQMLFDSLKELDDLIYRSRFMSPLWNIGYWYVSNSLPFVSALPPVSLAKQIIGNLEDGRFSFGERFILLPYTLDEVETHYLAYIAALVAGQPALAANELTMAHANLEAVLLAAADALPPSVVKVEHSYDDWLRVTWTNYVLPTGFQSSTDPLRTNWIDYSSLREHTNSAPVSLPASNGWLRLRSAHWHPSGGL